MIVRLETRPADWLHFLNLLHQLEIRGQQREPAERLDGLRYQPRHRANMQGCPSDDRRQPIKVNGFVTLPCNVTAGLDRFRSSGSNGVPRRRWRRRSVESSSPNRGAAASVFPYIPSVHPNSSQPWILKTEAEIGAGVAGYAFTMSRAWRQLWSQRRRYRGRHPPWSVCPPGVDLLMATRRGNRGGRG